MSRSEGNADRRIVLWLAAGVLLLVVLTSVFAPVTRDDDPTPTTYNSGTQGARAAFLLLADLGYNVSRSDTTAAQALDRADARHTTYILAEPNTPGEPSQKAEYAAILRFLDRGGRVLATGYGGAYFLPDARTGAPTQFFSGLCQTSPEGRGELALSGSVAIFDLSPWNALEPGVRVDQRCGTDAVVVHRPYPNGGEMVWWANAEPLSTRGIAQDNSLRLLLAAVGPAGDRHIVFDEFYHGVKTTASDYLKGLPVRSLAMQAALVLLLLVFSFSRRNGPIRDAVRLPRSSPVEFAQNMGALYERAGATQPATEASRRRVLTFLTNVCGLPAEVVRGPAAGIAALVHSRFGIDAQPLQQALERAEAARYDRLRPREALLLVRQLEAEMQRLQTVLRSQSAAPSITQETLMETIK